MRETNGETVEMSDPTTQPFFPFSIKSECWRCSTFSSLDPIPMFEINNLVCSDTKNKPVDIINSFQNKRMIDSTIDSDASFVY